MTMTRSIVAKNIICFRIFVHRAGSFSGYYQPMVSNHVMKKSLHFTGEGMRYAYERDDGLMSLTGNTVQRP